MFGSGPGWRDSTFPLSVGTTVVLTWPVASSKTKMLGRDSTMSDPRDVTWVKSPPTTIWLPISANAHTAPSSTFGMIAGTSDTTLS